jgi:adenosylcobyric acid synthase
MLGRRIADPLGLEGPPGETLGLGLLEVDTVLESAKILALRERSCALSGAPARGYEIHMGRTDGPGRRRPMLRGGDGEDGAMSADGRIMGCYLHGLLAADGYRTALLERIRARTGAALAYEARVEAALDALARHLEHCLDLDRLLSLAR